MINLKKAFRNIVSDLNKSIVCTGFIICIIITFFLCFTSIIYIDPNTGQECSVIEILTNKKNFRHIQFEAESVLKTSVNDYLTIFLPVLSSLPFAAFFCSERSSGYIRFNIIRTSRTSYCFSKFISALVSGGLSVMLGFVIYGITIYFIFPSDNSTITGFIKSAAGMSLYGAVSILPAFILSSFIKNKYIVCCMPFIIIHFYYTLMAKIKDYLIFSDNSNVIFKMQFLYPNNIRNIFETESDRMIIIVFYMLITAASLILFIAIMNRRLDYGE